MVRGRRAPARPAGAPRAGVGTRRAAASRRAPTRLGARPTGRARGDAPRPPGGRRGDRDLLRWRDCAGRHDAPGVLPRPPRPGAGRRRPRVVAGPPGARAAARARRRPVQAGPPAVQAPPSIDNGAEPVDAGRGDEPEGRAGRRRAAATGAHAVRSPRPRTASPRLASPRLARQRQQARRSLPDQGDHTPVGPETTIDHRTRDSRDQLEQDDTDQHPSHCDTDFPEVST